MTYYWILALFSLSLLRIGARNSKRTWTLLFIIAIFFVFFAFRIGFTPDYYNYEDYFDFYHFASVDVNYSVEVGFQWLCHILPSYRSLLIVYTALFCFCIYIAAQHFIDGRYWVLAFMILFFHTPFILGNMSGLRSGIVTCLFFIALLLKARNKTKYFILSVAIMAVSLLFHRSALALFPLLLLPSKAVGTNTKYLMYLFAFVFIIASLFFGEQLNQLALLLSDQVFEDRYEMYSDNYSISRVNIFLIIREIIVSVLLYITLGVTQIEKDSFKNYFIKVTSFFYLFLLAPQGIGLIVRYQYYFAFPCMMGISYLIGRADKRSKTIYILCLAFLAIWNLYFLFNGSIKFYSSYQNVLF